jgi:hypothetical protein
MTTLSLYPRRRRLDIASVLLTRCRACGRFDIGARLGTCAVCGGWLRLATLDELQDADGTTPPTMDRQGAG